MNQSGRSRTKPRQREAPIAYHAMDPATVAARLGVDPRTGLAPDEIIRRRERFGPNAITSRKGQPAIVRFLLQFHAPLIYILIVASIVALLLHEYIDASVIFAVVLANAIIGFVQEKKALTAIDALSRTMKSEATIRRDGRKERVESTELVPGDIVLLESGDKVPADLRLLSCKDLHAEESMLTGESLPVAKRTDAIDESAILADRRNNAFAGSLITRGQAEGVVIATGDRTEVGRISVMISSADQLATPLTRKIASFSHLLLWIILAVAALAFVVGILKGRSAEEMFMAAVALAVGAIPEGLPAAVTIMLAVGVSRMASRHAIIRKLPAVETLGSTTVICSDKTGTLTQNQMTVRAIWAAGSLYDVSGAGYDPVGAFAHTGESLDPTDYPALIELLRCGVLCNDAALFEKQGRWEIQGDPTEAALLVAARKAAIDQDQLARRFPRIDVIPFESERQYMATLHRDESCGTAFICVKGSVERTLAMCSHAASAQGAPEPTDPIAIEAAARELSGRGLRVLAFACSEAPLDSPDLTHPMVEQGLTFLGLQGMLDPPRAEVFDAIAKCRRAGVRVKMITGDHALTATKIAEMIGISDPSEDGSAAITGARLAEVTDESLSQVADATHVFARMTPEQKLRLVRALQRRGHIVAMTGDGVNDAPALRQADIGVAMGISGTEVAKDAADMVLADDNFASIESAVEEGRCVYDNLTKFILWTLPTNGGEALVILASIALIDDLPILPLHALYINMSCSILMGVPLIFEGKEAGVMDRPPRDPRKPILTFEMFMRTGLVSILICIGAMALFESELARGESVDSARTAAVSVIIFAEMFYLFSARALLRPVWAVPLFSNMWIWLGIALMLGVQLAFVYTPAINRLFYSAPLDWVAWSRIILAGGLVLVIVEIEKAIRRALASR